MQRSNPAVSPDSIRGSALFPAVGKKRDPGSSPG